MFTLDIIQPIFKMSTAFAPKTGENPPCARNIPARDAYTFRMTDFLLVFFSLHNNDPRPAGFGMFSHGHLVWLAVGVFFALILCRAYLAAPPSGRRRLRLATAFGALAVELSRAALLARAGLYGVDRLPMHLCAMAVYISVRHALRGGELTGQFLYAFCMPGALFALLFPDWSVYPFASFLTFAGFTGHFLIFTYVIMQTLTGDISPDIRRAPACLGVMLALAAAVFVFDRITATNYMFLNYPSPGSPLEWFSFLGRPGYILGYFPLIAAVWAAIYAPFCRRHIQKGADRA